MKLSVHSVLHPRAHIAGVLVHDADGLDYAPVAGSEQGVTFAATLTNALSGGMDHDAMLDYFYDKLGPSPFEVLSIPEDVDAPTRVAAVHQRAVALGIELNWTEATTTTSSAGPSSKANCKHRLPRSLKQAVAMKAISEVFRRHYPRHGLRLWESHPCDGQYDCLALAGGTLLCEFNLRGRSLRLGSVARPRPPASASAEWHGDVWTYPDVWQASGSTRDFVASLEARLGLPANPPVVPPTPSSIVLAVFAELAGRYSLSDVAPHFGSGWIESGGMLGPYLAAWAADILGVELQTGYANYDDKTRIAANALWMVSGDKGSPIIVDMRTAEVWPVGGERAGSVWKRYRKGAGIREIAWWIEGLWRG